MTLDLDEATIRDIPGVRIVRQCDFIGVVSASGTRFEPSASSRWYGISRRRYGRWRASTTRYALPRTTDSIIAERGDVAGALSRAADVVTVTYRGERLADIGSHENSDRAASRMHIAM